MYYIGYPSPNFEFRRYFFIKLGKLSTGTLLMRRGGRGWKGDGGGGSYIRYSINEDNRFYAAIEAIGLSGTQVDLDQLTNLDLNLTCLCLLAHLDLMLTCPDRLNSLASKLTSHN
jgi:hypothetical protein